MKIVFLDVDGVLNCASFFKKAGRGGRIEIDPERAVLIHRICEATDAKVVVSSSWRHSEEGMEKVRRAVGPFNVIGKTSIVALAPRGAEIKAWLDAHPEVERYAILDDDADMLPEQQPHFFHTSWHGEGLTSGIAAKIIRHLNTV